MARTPAETAPTHPDHQQMDRSNDPEVTRAMDKAAPELAMVSRRQRLTGGGERHHHRAEGRLPDAGPQGRASGNAQRTMSAAG